MSLVKVVRVKYEEVKKFLSLDDGDDADEMSATCPDGVLGMMLKGCVG